LGPMQRDIYDFLMPILWRISRREWTG